MEPDNTDLELFQAYMADPSARAAFVEYKARAAQDGTARRYEHVLRAVASQPWAIHEPMLAVIVDVLTFRAFGGRLTAEEIEGRIGAARRTTSTEAPRGVARIPISGVIIPKAGAFDKMSGGTSTQAIAADLRAAVAAPDVSSIILDMDSPGGAVAGVPELGDVIAETARIKPVTAVANHEALSAAYWLASQANRIVASPSARVGSIGVITRHEDQSSAEAMEGVKTTLVTAGKFKGEGNPFEPLTDEARDRLQSMVDEYYGMFVEAVARGRGVEADQVRTGFGEGRSLTASEALTAGLVDDVATLESVVASELSSNPPARVAAVGWEAELLAVGPERIAAVEPPKLLGDGTTQDEEIERMRLALHAEPQEPEIEAAVDSSAWDGNRAMGQCSSAAEYRQICAGEHNVGTPDQRQHWALPHHYLGKGPNSNGVRNALSRLPQTQNLSNHDAAQRHLDAHMNEINPGEKAQDLAPEVEEELSALQDELSFLQLSE